MATWTRAFASLRNGRFSYSTFSATRDHPPTGLTKSIWAVLYWAPAAIFLTTEIVWVQKISGKSMQPTLNPDSSGSTSDFGLFFRQDPFDLARLPGQFRRDDIIILKSPEDPNRMLIKRVVATEGDSVKTLPPYPEREVTVPQGHVWIEGDDNFRTDDSNKFGPVSESLIQSKLRMLVWPPSRFGAIPDPSVYLESGKPLERHMRDALWRQEMRHARVKVAPARPETVS